MISHVVCKNAIDPEFRFNSTLYYLADSTDVKCKCKLLQSRVALEVGSFYHPVLGNFDYTYERLMYSGYKRVAGCQCQRD